MLSFLGNRTYLAALALLVIVKFITPNVSAAEICNASDLKVLTYNIYMRPSQMFWFNNDFMAKDIPNHIKDVDVVIFQEAFDDSAREILIHEMRKSFKYISKHLSEDAFPYQDGGVFIMSKWPIQDNQTQEVYEATSGMDALSRKGVVYVEIVKDEGFQKQNYHIFGTHLNAIEGDGQESIKTQNAQLIQLSKFIQAQHIPQNEPILIAGDFNIDPEADNYNKMLNTLNAGHMPQNDAYSFDANTNALACEHHKTYDHVLFSRNRQPSIKASTIHIDMPSASETWKGWVFGNKYLALSDHFPVYVNYCFDERH